MYSRRFITSLFFSFPYHGNPLPSNLTLLLYPDMILVLASVGTLVVGSTQEQFGQAVLSGLRFFQILRMVRMDRKGGTWKLLGSVVWAHRQVSLGT